MNPNPNPAHLIKKNMDSILLRWKWLKFGQHLGTAGTLFCLFWFAVEVAAWRGILSQAWQFYLLLFFLGFGGFLAFFMVCFIVVANQEKRSWIACNLEKACPDMMDRINTLVFLEEHPRGMQMLPLKRKIEEQAAQVFQKEKPANPFSSRRARIHLAVFGLALIGVIAFQLRFDPFNRLLNPPVAVAAPVSTAKTESPFELAAPNVTETPEKKTWGEVRIVDPGHDVKLTKIDVLPLQIEMAASEAMQQPTWITSINGAAEVPHELAAPPDPNYAVYQPMIYLDELKVTEWDVVSYYAKVQTCKQDEYASKMNFIEIRPFREDILKMAGGKGDKSEAYSLLSEITGLIKQQTEVLQQTHVHQQTAYANDEMRLQDSKKLTDAENDLAVSTNHLFAKIASEEENAPITEILDQLTSAEQEMDHATEALRDDVVVEGKQREQGALAHLIASRKAFQKVMSNGGFGNSSGDDDDDNITTAEDSQKALSQVSELRDRDKAMLESLHKLVQQQQSLTKTSSAGWNHAQTDLKNNLHSLIQQNPDLFRDAEPEEAAVQENMAQALLALSSNDPFGSERYITRSGESMGDLEKVVTKNHEAQQLAQAYALKKIIDQNIKQLGQEQAKPGSLSNQDAQTLSQTAQNSAGTLKEITDGMNGAGFGPDLGQSLSSENQQALDEALQKFALAQSGAPRGSAAGTAQQGLQKISRAFEQSQPTLTKDIRGHDQLQPSSPGEALGQASQELQSLIMAQKDNHPATPGDEAKAEVDILHDLESGLDQKDLTPEKAALLAKADELLKTKKADEAVDPEALKKLLDQIEAVRIEASNSHDTKPTDAETTFVDPSKFPPTYRDRIKSYFEQLSGHSQ